MKLFFLLLTITRVDSVEIHHAVATGLSFEDCLAQKIETHDRIGSILGENYTLACEEDHYISQ